MKKLISVFAAALTAAAMLTPMTSGAVFKVTPINDERFADLTEKGYTQIEPVHFFDWGLPSGKKSYDYMFVNETGTEFITFTEISLIKTYVELADGVEKKDVEDALSEKFGGDYKNKVQFYLSQAARDSRDFYLEVYGADRVLKKNEYINMLEFMKEQGFLKAGKLITNLYQEQEFYPDVSRDYIDQNYVALYRSLDKNDTYKYYDKISEYAEKELEGYTVEKIGPEEGGYTYCVKVTAPEELTVLERVQITEQIYQGTGRAPSYVSPAANKVVDGNEIDVVGAVKGDANCDGNATIADAVAILQSIGNHDKFPLSQQGEYNGDLVGDNDGITANDALEIQKIDAQKNS